MYNIHIYIKITNSWLDYMYKKYAHGKQSQFTKYSRYC